MSIYISTDASHLTMKGSGKVQIKTSIKIYGTGTEMPVNIEADFTNIPHHLHQIYYQSLVSQYNTSLGVYDNTKEDEPYPMTIKEKQQEWRLNKIVDLIFESLRFKTK